MRIVWDEIKRWRNVEKHGLDFADLTATFFLEVSVGPAKEGRFKAIGRLRDGTIVVIFAMLGREAVSVVSMRPANGRERRGSA
jgi:uncharacterized protein